MKNYDSTLIDKEKVDDLLGCLLFLSKFHKRETSPESLTYGLPIHNNSMNISMFYESANRIGLVTRNVKRNSIKNITKLALPSVLILDNNKACILLDYDLEKDLANIILPSLSSGETIVNISKLESEYTGEAIIIKPEYNLIIELKKKF